MIYSLLGAIRFVMSLARKVKASCRAGFATQASHLANERKKDGMSIFSLVIKVFAAILVLAFPLVSYANPVLFYTDIISGPNAGGKDNAGVFVRLYGKGFGASRGTSTVTVGGGAVSGYQLWTDTEISIQLGANAKTGSIVVNGGTGQSNALPFTVRSGRIFFVDVNSPSNPGSGTFSDPWRSPKSFYDSAAAGDTVYLRAGTYSGTYGYPNGSANLVMRHGTGSGYTAAGTQSMPIAWLGYPGETALFSAPGPTGNTSNIRGWPGDAVDKAPDWTVIGNLSFLAYNGCISAGGTNSAAHGWRIVGNKCEGLTRTSQLQSGTIVPGGNYAKVLGNVIHGGRTGDKLDHAIYSMSCSTDIEIAWNHIYDNNFATGPLISVNYEGTRCADGQYAGVASIHDNLVDATNYPCRCVYAYDQSFNYGDPVTPVTRVFNNVFISCGGPGDAGALVMRNGAMEAYNNTFYDTRTYCLVIAGPTPRVAYLNFKNNICHMRSSAIAYTSYESDAPVHDAEKNIYYGRGNYVGGWDTSPINAEPRFLNAAGANFHLSAGSPAINAGSTAIGTYVARDKDGNLRSRSTSDIGAYLFNSLNSSVQDAPLDSPQNLRFR